MRNITAFLLPLFLLLLSGCAPAGTPPREQVRRVETVEVEAEPDAPTVTVMVYMVGSDLESQHGLATLDLEEMQRAGLDGKVNVIVQTMGCTDWANDQISGKVSQRFAIQDHQLIPLESDLGQLDSTKPETLRDFIRYCAQSFPADRNILIFWDHGGGPVYGFGYDENQGEAATLTLSELRGAISDGGVPFDFIGFDACLMGSLETAMALKDCGGYLITSEDFVSSHGWEYQYWLTELGNHPGIGMEDLGQIIVDTYVTESEEAGDAGVLTVLDLSQVDNLWRAWTDYGSANTLALTGRNFTWRTHNTGRSAQAGWTDNGGSGSTMADYFLTDLMALAYTVGGDGQDALEQALAQAIVCSASTQEDSAYSGLAVTLPYGSEGFCRHLQAELLACGVEENYTQWLTQFARVDAADFSGWEAWTDFWDNSAPYGGWRTRQ